MVLPRHQDSASERCDGVQDIDVLRAENDANITAIQATAQAEASVLVNGVTPSCVSVRRMHHDSAHSNNALCVAGFHDGILRAAEGKG